MSRPGSFLRQKSAQRAWPNCAAPLIQPLPERQQGRLRGRARHDVGRITSRAIMDLKADWRKWSQIERWASVSFATAATITVPVLLLLGVQLPS